MPKDGRKQNGPTKQSGTSTKNQSSILSILALPILCGLVVMTLGLIDGMAAFPPYPQIQPFLRVHQNPDDVEPIVLSTPGSNSFKVFFWHTIKKVPVSPWHDINLYGKKGEIRYIVEIPRGTGAKLEIQPGSLLNPILQDRFKKSGSFRFTQEPYPFNYGAFSQTWEDPSVPDHWTSLVGDNDPLDVVDIGSGVYYPGDIVTVKVLGVLALLGTGDETDWKVIVIGVDDPLAKTLNDAGDIDRELGLSIVEFFSFYKVFEGEEPSKFGFNAAILNKTFAQTVIDDKHQKWQSLVRGPVDPRINNRVFSTKCVLCPDPQTNKKNQITDEEARQWAYKTTADLLEGI